MVPCVKSLNRQRDHRLKTCFAHFLFHVHFGSKHTMFRHIQNQGVSSSNTSCSPKNSFWWSPKPQISRENNECFFWKQRIISYILCALSPLIRSSTLILVYWSTVQKLLMIMSSATYGLSCLIIPLSTLH